MAPMNYPPEALKEIVANAVIHRDYNVSDDILVSVFNNRVEVRSPGTLPGHMTLDNLLQERFARNPTVVRLLNKYPNPPNKDIGEGLRTVFDKMKEARLKAPTFRMEGGYFIVELGHTPLARPHEIIPEYLESNSEVTNSIGRSLTGITSENAMKDVFYGLRDAGKIERVPGKVGNKSAWQLVAPAEDNEREADPLIDATDQPAVSSGEPEEAKPPTQDPKPRPTEPGRTSSRAGRAPGRNAPCPCGSGQKYKRCHGRPPV
jgi:ATP-dependent DNA helicase RecG